MKHEDDLDSNEPQATTGLQKAFGKVLTPFEEFIHHESTSGILLMACAVIALILANTAAYTTYEHVLHMNVGFTFGPWELEKTLHHWINDGLMALFFFLVGLEIKREVLVGELADMRRASLPIFAAVGGMLVPGAIYAAINWGGEGIHGWGVPLATDIAFAVGAMILLGSRAPKALLTFVVALAIVDDLGAVVIIALFYTDQINMGALAMAALFIAILLLFNKGNVRKPLPYIIIGCCLWLAMLKSGVHATLAGVITALLTPATTMYSPKQFSKRAKSLLTKFDAAHQPGSIMRNEKQLSILQTFENGILRVEAPLQRMEHNLHIPVAFLIIPIFALANAGVPIELDGFSTLVSHPVTLGVIFGLLAGKVLGITFFCWLAVRLGVGQLPTGVTFHHIIGAGFLAGIGFTMSIFIAELAFKGWPEGLLMAKTGVLIASLLAGVGGYLYLRFVPKAG